MGASGSKFKEEIELIKKLVYEINSKSEDLQNTCDNYIPVLESQLRKHLKMELLDVRDAIILVPQADSVDVNGRMRTKQDICDQIARHYRRIFTLVQMICNVYNIEGSTYFKSIAEFCLNSIHMQSRSMTITACIDTKQRANADPSMVDISTLAGLSLFLESLVKIDGNTTVDEGRQQFLDSLRNQLSNHDLPYCSNLYRIKNCKSKQNNVNTETPATTHMRIHPLNPNFSDEFCNRPQDIVVLNNSPRWNDARRLYRKLQDDYAAGLESIRKLLQEILTNKGTLRSKTITITDKELTRLEHRAKELIMNFYFTSLQNFYNLLDLAIEQSEDKQVQTLNAKYLNNVA